MTPAQVRELTDVELEAFVRSQKDEERAIRQARERARAGARRGRRR